MSFGQLFCGCYCQLTELAGSCKKAITEVGEVLQFYASDRRFPTWGFGGKTYGGSVSYCFNLTGSPTEFECHLATLFGFDFFRNLLEQCYRTRNNGEGVKSPEGEQWDPEVLLRKSSSLNGSDRSDVFFEANSGDAVEAHEWKCVRTINDFVEDILQGAPKVRTQDRK